MLDQIGFALRTGAVAVFLVKLHEHADLDVMGKTNQQDITLRLDWVLGCLWKVI